MVFAYKQKGVFKKNPHIYYPPIIMFLQVITPDFLTLLAAISKSTYTYSLISPIHALLFTLSGSSTILDFIWVAGLRASQAIIE